MSSETREWLSQNILVGFTEKRGNAWHWKEGDDNHFPGAVPLEDVQRRLFNWYPVSEPVYTRHGPIPNKNAWTRSDTNHVMGIFTDGYGGHDYSEWLLTNVGNILDDDLGIGSAGLLRGGAVAFVSVEVPETSHFNGVTYRANLMACTSFDGSLATTYKRVVTNVVCDNTMSAGLSENGQVYRVKHTKNSGLKIADAREALAIVHQSSTEFEAEVERLLSTPVNDAVFEKFVASYVPLTDDSSKRATTIGEAKREKLQEMWRADPMVSPWRGTGWGVLQAVSTWTQHHSIVRKTTDNANRIERNLFGTLKGAQSESDDHAMKVLAAVL